MIKLGYGVMLANMAACAVNVQIGFYGLATFNGLVSIMLMLTVIRASV